MDTSPARTDPWLGGLATAASMSLVAPAGGTAEPLSWLAEDCGALGGSHAVVVEIAGVLMIHRAPSASPPGDLLLQHGQGHDVGLLRRERKRAEGAGRGADAVALRKHGGYRKAPSTRRRLRTWGNPSADWLTYGARGGRGDLGWCTPAGAANSPFEKERCQGPWTLTMHCFSMATETCLWFLGLPLADGSPQLFDVSHAGRGGRGRDQVWLLGQRPTDGDSFPQLNACRRRVWSRRRERRRSEPVDEGGAVELADGRGGTLVALA